jgi:murein L,D-transpeptidase YafK
LTHCARYFPRVIPWLAVVLFFVHPGSFPSAAASSYDIEIKKSKRLLIVREGEEVHKVYRISWGRGGPGDKHRFGDRKTPVGTYRVIGFNERSKFDFFIRLNYPNVKDAFYGLKSDVINRDEFDRIVRALRRDKLPPQDTALGGAIGIHGLGRETPEKLRIHQNLNWTEGCIALRNEEIHELRPYVNIGTRVVITE